MEHEISLKETQKMWHGTFRAYMIGFFSSLFFTSISFSLVAAGALPKTDLIVSLVVLALLQAVFQLLFFLHLGKEEHPKWESVVFFLMLVLLLIIAIGSLWIMNDLNMRTMQMEGMKP